MNHRPLSKIAIVILFFVLASVRIGNAQDPQPPGGEEFAARWPMQVSTPQGQVTLFQPQMEDLKGDTLTARAAVELTPPNQQSPVFGAIWFKSRVNTDRVSRMVEISDVTVTRVKFASGESGNEQDLTTAMQQAFAAQPISLSLDQLLTMVQTTQAEESATTDLQTAPPKVIFRDHPAINVQYDGEPQFVEMKDSNLKRVANTPFFIVQDPASGTCYLKGAGLWFAAPGPKGPFQRMPKAPDPVSALADADDYKDPQSPLKPEQISQLEIVTSTEPTELIWTDGPEKMATIAGTSLLYVTNTDSDLFTDINTQQTYILLSGRWYVAANRNGPWAYVPPDKLPPDFQKIPPNSDQGDVLAHVAGTRAADEAVADTYVPQTAAVDRANFEQPVIEYDGDPAFEAIDGSQCAYAVNTDVPVVLVDGRYYCCHHAVWYIGPGARGPWGICTTVPGEIYRIPASCPIYPVRYVYVYGFTPDVVYVGYTPGYVGCYHFNRVVVYGTGYHYRPWFRREFFPRPCTFGFAAHYNSYVGHWGFSLGLATGGGSLWVGAEPALAVRRERFFGFGGYRPVVAHRDVHIDMFRRQYVSRVRGEPEIVAGARRGGIANPAAQQRRDQFARNVYDRRRDVRPLSVLANPSIPSRGAGLPGPNGNQADRRGSDAARNDVFTDREGNVFRRTTNGWERRDLGQWRATPDRTDGPVRSGDRGAVVSPAPGARGDGTARGGQGERGPQRPPTVVRPNDGASDTRQLDRDYGARIAGESRLRNYERQTQPEAPRGGNMPRGGGESPGRRGR